MSQQLLKFFVVFLVVVEPISLIPVFVGLTKDGTQAQRRHMARRAVLISAIILTLFAVGGGPFLRLMSISLDSFRIFGGLLLFLISLEMVFARTSGTRTSTQEELESRQREDISVVGHVGRPDEELHELGEHELILIVQGPHGYISSSWYGAAPAVPTWNFIVVHLHGVPEILSAEDNLEVLGQLVDHFERRVAEPRPLHRSEADSTFERALSRGTVGFRLTPSRITAKQKMSQNKSREVFTTVLAQLEGDGPYGDALLAREMRLARTGL